MSDRFDMNRVNTMANAAEVIAYQPVWDLTNKESVHKSMSQEVGDVVNAEKTVTVLIHTTAPFPAGNPFVGMNCGHLDFTEDLNEQSLVY